MLRKEFESSPSMSVRIHYTNCLVAFPEMTNLELEEDGVRIALTIVDTPGFGDNIDNEFACVVFKLHVQSHFLTRHLVSKKLLATLSANMMISLQKSPVSSVIHVSGITESTLFCTLSHLLVMRACRTPLLLISKLNPL